MARTPPPAVFAMGNVALVAREPATLSLRTLNNVCTSVRAALPDAKVWLRAVSRGLPTDTRPSDVVRVTAGQSLIEIDRADTTRASSVLNDSARILGLAYTVETTAS